MKQHHLTIALLSGVLAFGLAGCGKKEEPKSGLGQQIEKSVTAAGKEADKAVAKRAAALQDEQRAIDEAEAAAQAKKNPPPAQAGTQPSDAAAKKSSTDGGGNR